MIVLIRWIEMILQLMGMLTAFNFFAWYLYQRTKNSSQWMEVSCLLTFFWTYQKKTVHGDANFFSFALCEFQSCNEYRSELARALLYIFLAK